MAKPPTSGMQRRGEVSGASGWEASDRWQSRSSTAPNALRCTPAPPSPTEGRRMPSSQLQAFHVIGVSHRTAPLKVREQLVLPPAEATAWLDQPRAAGRSAVILATCNPFEFYRTARDDPTPSF